MYVYLFRCMSRLGMLIRVTARAVLSIVNGEANFVDPAESQWCQALVAVNAGGFPAIFKLCGSHSYLAARRDSWQLIDKLRQG